MSLVARAFARLNTRRPWYSLPLPLSIPNLVVLRNQLRAENLHDTEVLPVHTPLPVPAPPADLHARSSDGSHNDRAQPRMGMAGARFGRNIPLSAARTEAGTARLLSPNPRLVSQRLLRRETFQPAGHLNLLAAAWIQFMVHDWFSHGVDRQADPIRVPRPDGDSWPEPELVVQPTRPDPTRPPHGPDAPPTYTNTETHWWDGSQLYGSTQARQDQVRAGVGGRLIVGADGRLPIDPDTGVDLAGFSENWWLGLSLLHGLFVREHNAICAMLQRHYPSWDDERLFQKARLINAALLARIHTIEWTPAILATPTLRAAMDGNWWGLLGEDVRRRRGRVFDSDVLSGIMGSEVDHHGAPFSMTEEFVAVYRMHPLLPDDLTLRRLRDDSVLAQYALPDLAGPASRAVLESHSLDDLLYSLGVQHPGALVLHNYPRHLQDLTLPDGTHLDLGMVDVLRDRERGIPRYCEFRRLLHLPVPASFAELTDNPAWARELAAVYDRVEDVDLMVGMFAETPPPGFGFSDTAFRIFILMASRRLKSDRFYTDDFRPEVYTPEGLAWVQGSTMTTVLCRHHPALAGLLAGQENAFAPWRSAGG